METDRDDDNMNRTLIVLLTPEPDTFVSEDRGQIEHIKSKCEDLKQIGGELMCVRSLECFHEESFSDRIIKGKFSCFIIICLVYGDGQGAYFPDGQRETLKPMESLVHQVNAFHVIENSLKLLLIIDFHRKQCNTSVKPLYCTNVKNTVVFQGSTENSNRDGKCSRLVLIEEFVGAVVEWSGQTEILQFVQKIQDGYCSKMSNGNELFVPATIFPMDTDVKMSNGVSANSNPLTAHEISWINHSGFGLNKGHCFVFHDLKHTIMAKSLECTLINQLLTAERHNIVQMCEVMNQVSKNSSLYNDCGVIIIAVLSRHYKNSKGHLCIDTGKSYRYASDLFPSMSGLKETQIVTVILDCEYEAVEPNAEQVLKSTHERKFSPSIEYSAKGEALVEELIKDLSLDLSLQQIFFKNMNEFVSHDSCLINSESRDISLRKCKNAQVPHTFKVLPDNGDLPGESGVADIANEVISRPGSKWILSDSMGNGKTVATLQVAKYITSHFPSHRVMFVNDMLLAKFCKSDEQVTADNVIKSFATDGAELSEINVSLQNQQFIIMIDELHLLIGEFKSKVLKILQVLKGPSFSVWLSIRDIDFEMVTKCLEWPIHLKVKPLCLEDQAKILSVKLNMPHSEISSYLQKKPLGKPLHLQMAISTDHMAMVAFDFYLRYVEEQIKTVLRRRGHDPPDDEMLKSSLHELLVACVKLQESGSYHADYQAFVDLHFGFHRSLASFFLAYNFSASIGLENEIFIPVKAENILSQRDLYQEREFFELRLAKNEDDVNSCLLKLWDNIKDITEVLKTKAHHCIYNVVSEGCVRLCSFLLDPIMLEHLDMVNFLEPESKFMQHWIKDYPDHSPLYYALRSKEEQVALMLMRISLKPSSELKLYFHEAAKNGYVQATKMLIEFQSQDASNNIDNKGFTPLHYGVYYNHNDWVRMNLVMMGSNDSVGAVTAKGVTPIFFAAGNGNLEIFRFLFLFSSDSIEKRDIKGSSILHWILKSKANNWLEMLQYVLQLRTVNVNCQDNNGETALFIAAREKKFAALQLLADHGADLNLTNKDGQTLLHLLAQSGNADECLQMMAMLDQWIIKQVDCHGRTALHYAVEANCRVDVVELMILTLGECVTSIDLNGQNVLHLAVKHNSEHVVEALAEFDDMHYVRDANEDTPMHLAFKGHNIATLRFLAEKTPQILQIYDEFLLEAAISEKNAYAIKILPHQDTRRILNNLNFEVLNQHYDYEEMELVQLDGAVAGPSRNMQDFEGAVGLMEVEEMGTNVVLNKRYDYFVHEHLNNLNLNFALHRYFTFKKEFDHQKRFIYAQSGFFYTRDDENIQCHYCHLLIPFQDDIALNLSLEQVNVRHASLSKLENRKSCPLLDGNDVDDVPILNPTNYIFEAHRLYSFLHIKWPNPYVSEYDLAKYGFYYTEQDDNCRCLFCKLEVRGWEPGDTAEVEHRRWNPRCPFLSRGSQTENVPIGEELNSPDHDHLSNPFKPTPMAKFGPHVKFLGNLKHNFTYEALGITPIGDMKYRQYSTLQSREKSFKIWPKQLAQKPDILSSAGFFYTGSGDRVICFQCGGGLKDWDPKDNPWVEHAKWFSRCPYLNIKRGKKFIDHIIKTNEDHSSVARETPIKVIKAPVPGSLQCWECRIKDANCVSLPCGHITTCVDCVQKKLNCKACNGSRVAYTEVFL